MNLSMIDQVKTRLLVTLKHTEKGRERQKVFGNLKAVQEWPFEASVLIALIQTENPLGGNND